MTFNKILKLLVFLLATMIGLGIVLIINEYKSFMTRPVEINPVCEKVRTYSDPPKFSDQSVNPLLLVIRIENDKSLSLNNLDIGNLEE